MGAREIWEERIKSTDIKKRETRDVGFAGVPPKYLFPKQTTTNCSKAEADMVLISQFENKSGVGPIKQPFGLSG